MEKVIENKNYWIEYYIRKCRRRTDFITVTVSVKSWVIPWKDVP